MKVSLRLITGAPWYINNTPLNKDLNISTVKKLATTNYKRFYFKLDSHTNSLIKNISSHTLSENPEQGLKRTWSSDI